MKQRKLLILLSLTLLIIASSCATTDVKQEQADYLEQKVRENPNIIELYLYLIDYYWNEQADLANSLRIANLCVENNANKPKAHILAAQTLYNTGFEKEAESFLRRRIAERKNSEAVMLLASNLREEARFTEARELLTTEISGKLNELSEEQKEFSELQKLEFARIDFAEKKYDDSKNKLQNLMQNSSKPQIINAAGCLMIKILVAEENFEGVVETSEKILEQPSISAEFIELLAYSYIYFKEHHELANVLVKVYKKVQDVQLKQTIMFQLVLNEILREDTEEALSYVKLGLELKPVFAPFLIFDYYLNYYKFEDKDADELEAKRETLISYDIQYFKGPEKFENFRDILYGNLLRYLNLFDQAEEVYTKILDEQPDLTWLMLALAELSIDRQNYTDAVFWFAKVTSLNIKNSELFCQIGDCMLKLGELDKAKSAFESALKEYPENPRALKGIAIVRVKSGEFKVEDKFPSLFAAY